MNIQEKLLEELGIAVIPLEVKAGLDSDQTKKEIEKLKKFLNTLNALENPLRLRLVGISSEAKGAISWYEDSLKRAEEFSKKLREYSNLGERFASRTFGTIDDGMDADALASAKAYTQKFNAIKRNEKNGIALVGGCGIGKTHLAAAITNFLIDNLGIAVCFGTQVELLDIIRCELRNGKEETKQRMKNIELLVLDDFGKEKSSDWTSQVLFEILNSRYEKKLPTIITTNLTPDELSSKYGNAIVSRLVESCKWMEMKGKDRRR